MNNLREKIMKVEIFRDLVQSKETQYPNYGDREGQGRNIRKEYFGNRNYH